MRFLPLAAALGLVSACSSPGGAPSPDAGSEADAGLVDAGSEAGSDAGAGGGDAGGTCPPAKLAGAFLPLIRAIADDIEQHAWTDSESMAIPSTADRDAFATVITAVLAGDTAAACQLPPSYRLLQMQDPAAGSLYVVAEVDAAGKPAAVLRWGTYAALAALDEAPYRKLAVEAPHPLYDTNTEIESADLFVQARARYFLLAGTHRCADKEPSPCTGTSDVCGGPVEPYRVSDVAHAVAAPFYAVHVALSSASPDLLFLQLHGNSAACPDALVSDVSGDWPGAGFAADLAAAVESKGATAGRCGAGFPTSACDLCGGGNVEARATAASKDPCSKGGTEYGRFVHLEQSKALRKDPAAGAPGYQRLIDATMAVVPATP
jgi:hypothetical protein